MERVIAKNRTIEQTSQISRFDLFCFWFVTIDLLFLPYFTLISVSYSVPIIILWMLLHAKSHTTDSEVAIVVVISIFMVLSTGIALVYPGEVRFETTFSTSIKRLIQYSVCFGYYFFYKNFFKSVKVDLNKMLLWFILFVTLFAFFYLINPQLYASMKIVISPADNHTRRYLANMVHYRFNYWWTDPNNIAYLVAGVLYWGLTRRENSVLYKFLLSVMSMFIIASTTSNGGLIMSFVMIAIVFCGWIVKMFKRNKVKYSSFLFCIGIALVLVIALKVSNILDYIANEFVVKIQERFNIYASTGNISGGRLADVLKSIEYLNPVFFLMGSGKEGFTTENGHIYWIGMYGLPAYIGVFWLMFRKLKNQKWINYIWILPFFVCFTMNIGIGEFKWLAIYFMLLAYSRFGISEEANV